MTAAALLSLAAPQGHAGAEAVRIAFALRGTDLPAVPVQGGGLALTGGPIRLTLRRGADAAVILRDPQAMLELAEDLHPGQPLHPLDLHLRARHREAFGALHRLAGLIERLCLTGDPREVDLATHLARDQIAQIARLLPPGAPALSLLEVAALPLLWRIDGLDGRFGAHLLTGFDALRDRQAQALQRAPLAGVLRPPLREDWLRAVAQAGGLIARPEARPDWSAALGPEAPPRGPAEKAVPRAGQRTKIHSIGSADSIR